MRALLFTLLFTSNLAKAQTTFAPLGARWTYDMSHSQMTMEDPHWSYVGWVSGDTVVAGRSCTTLRFQSPTFYYPYLGNDVDEDMVLATSGDSILLYTPYDASFHPLMILDAEPGDTWSIPVAWALPWAPDEVYTDTVTYTALGCDTLWFEGSPLRRMQYSCSTLEQLLVSASWSGIFVERIGDLRYLFPWYSATVSDQDQFNHLICYADPTLSWPTAGSACGFPLAAEELAGRTPGALASVVVQDGVLVVTTPEGGDHHLRITDLLGRTLHASPLRPGTTRIPVHLRGIHVLTVWNAAGQYRSGRYIGY